MLECDILRSSESKIINTDNRFCLVFLGDWVDVKGNVFIKDSSDNIVYSFYSTLNTWLSECYLLAINSGDYTIVNNHSSDVKICIMSYFLV